MAYEKIYQIDLKLLIKPHPDTLLLAAELGLLWRLNVPSCMEFMKKYFGRLRLVMGKTSSC